MATALLRSRRLRRSDRQRLGAEVDGRRRKNRSRSSGVQLTKVGIWYIIGTAIVVIAAINTGNNGLFLTVAAMVATFVLAQILSSTNIANLSIEVSGDEEIYANSPASLEVKVTNRNRFLASWLIVVATGPESLEPPERRRRKTMPWLIPFLPGGGAEEGFLELLLERRGLRRLRFLAVSSLFPMGLFRKQRRYAQELEILVYPEIYAASPLSYSETGPGGDRSARRQGIGHELHTLRDYQPGDDPRSIHWKQSARHQSLIVQQRQTEKLRRLRIVFDNAVGELEDPLSLKNFERLVSEAASAAVEALDKGYDVALLTREGWIDYASGDRQRRQILEALARIEALPAEARALAEDDEKGLQLRLGAKTGAKNGAKLGKGESAFGAEAKREWA